MTLQNELSILKLYDRFLCVVNDWYGSTDHGKRCRTVHPNSYISLNTHLPSLLFIENHAEDLSFDIEYEFGVKIQPSLIKNIDSINSLFNTIFSKIRIQLYDN